MTRKRACAHCSTEFEYEVGRGTDRRLCSDSCRTARRHVLAKAKPLCVVPQCVNPRAYSSGVCNSCYYRLRRTGTVVRREWKYRSLQSNGYIRLFDKLHPLATPEGFVFEHRKVLYDAIGPGLHPCHWCQRPVEWAIGGKRHGLVPDHLDGNKANNLLTNLVPACHRCNAMRGLFMAWVREHQTDPFLWDLFLKARGVA